MRKKSKIPGVVLAIAVVYGLLALWVWALFGMSEQTGIAHFITVTTLLFGALIASENL